MAYELPSVPKGLFLIKAVEGYLHGYENCRDANTSPGETECASTAVMSRGLVRFCYVSHGEDGDDKDDDAVTEALQRVLDTPCAEETAEKTEGSACLTATAATFVCRLKAGMAKKEETPDKRHMQRLAEKILGDDGGGVAVVAAPPVLTPPPPAASNLNDLVDPFVLAAFIGASVECATERNYCPTVKKMVDGIVEHCLIAKDEDKEKKRRKKEASDRIAGVIRATMGKGAAGMTGGGFWKGAARVGCGVLAACTGVALIGVAIIAASVGAVPNGMERAFELPLRLGQFTFKGEWLDDTKGPPQYVKPAVVRRKKPA